MPGEALEGRFVFSNSSAGTRITGLAGFR